MPACALLQGCAQISLRSHKGGNIQWVMRIVRCGSFNADSWQAPAFYPVVAPFAAACALGRPGKAQSAPRLGTVAQVHIHQGLIRDSCFLGQSSENVTVSASSRMVSFCLRRFAYGLRFALEESSCFFIGIPFKLSAGNANLSNALGDRP